MPHFSFIHESPMVIKTLFSQLMLEKGYLASTVFYSSYSHTEKHVAQYIQSVDDSFAIIAKAIVEGNPENYLKGPVCHSGFKRLA
jgi:hypothetical protein